MSTLIVYASKHGAAERCARSLSEKLTGKVDVFNIAGGKMPELNGYDKVIIGGSIYAGRIQKEVSEFCTKNISVLKGKKIGLFICCMIEKNTEMQLSSNFPQELLRIASVKESLGFEFDYKKLGFLEKTMTKMISKMAPKDDQSLPELDLNNHMSRISQEKVNKFADAINIA